MIVFLNCRKNWLLFIQITLFALFECYFIFFQILNLQIDSLHSCHEHTVQNPQFSSLRQTETNDRNPSWGNVHLLFLSVAQSSNWPKILHVKSAKVNQQWFWVLYFNLRAGIPTKFVVLFGQFHVKICSDLFGLWCHFLANLTVLGRTRYWAQKYLPFLIHSWTNSEIWLRVRGPGNSFS